jgi:uncharacterized oxidoreductase
MKLEGRTILLTGGSAGIGLRFAQEFLRLGNTVIVTGRSAAKLQAAKEEHPELHTIQCDASDPKAVKALAERVKSEFPKLDVLMNNAGVFHFQNVLHQTDDLESLTRELDINVKGPIWTLNVLVETLIANKGTLINVSSGLAFVPIQCAPVYCATKAALHNWTISVRQQLAGKVEVIELMPPAVKTRLTSDIPEGGDFKIITTDELLEASLKGLRSGATEIRPGQANQLHWMSRIAPGFINGQLAKGSAELVPR